ELPARRTPAVPGPPGTPTGLGPPRPVRAARQRPSGAAPPADRALRRPFRHGRAVRHGPRPGDDVRPALRRDRGAGLSAAPRPRERARGPYPEEDGMRFRVRPRRGTALLAVTGLAAGLLLGSPQPASAANLVTNP